MQLRHSQRRAAKMRLALQGASGSGKTYSSLLIAHGMTSDWSQNRCHRHRERRVRTSMPTWEPINVLSLSEPYNPEKLHRRHRYLRKRRHGGYHHRQHLPLLGLPAGFPRQSARQLLCQLGQGYAPAERLYPADSQLLVPCDLYDAKQAGVRAQRSKQRQDDPRESGS